MAAAAWDVRAVEREWIEALLAAASWPIDAAAVAALGASGKLVHLRRKQLLYREDDGFVYLVRSGLVRRFRSLGRGERLALADHLPLDVVGEAALAGARADEALAVEDSELVAFPVDTLRGVVVTRPALSALFLERALREGVRGERRLRALVGTTVEARVASFLVEAAARHGQPHGLGCVLGVKYTHQDIADYVGAQRETVTVVLGELRRRALIEFERRRIVVRDLDQLARRAA